MKYLQHRVTVPAVEKLVTHFNVQHCIYYEARPCCVFSRVMSPQLSGWPLSGLFTSQHCSCINREEGSLCRDSEEYHVLNPNILYNSDVSVAVLKLPSVSVSGLNAMVFLGIYLPRSQWANDDCGRGALVAR